jgi:hypothetical protein
MGLLTDGQINNTQDLRNYENGILDIASLENIDLTGKMALAQDEISTGILTFLLKQITRDLRSFPYLLPGESQRRHLGVTDVTVTPQLKRWHALKTLALTYADAYNNQLNDRYGGKWKQYETLAQAAEQSFYETGVGLSLDPIGRPVVPTLGSVAGTGVQGTFYVQITWTNRAAQEGSPSEVVSFTTSAKEELTVTTMDAPANATGFNVYTGLTPEGVTLQNDVPIQVGTQWVLLPSGIRKGRKPGQGQSADRYIVNDRILLRG